MDIVGNVKEIADLAKKYNDIEFYRKIVHLEGEVMELTRAKREVELKVEDLEKQLALKAKMAFKQPFYYQEGDDVPFCPSCFEDKTRAVHLVFSYEGAEETRWDCPACKTMYLDKKAGHQRGRHQITPSW
jgi:hypothetical protein